MHKAPGSRKGRKGEREKIKHQGKIVNKFLQLDVIVYSQRNGFAKCYFIFNKRFCEEIKYVKTTSLSMLLQYLFRLEAQLNW
jgi:hypothetical protein